MNDTNLSRDQIMLLRQGYTRALQARGESPSFALSQAAKVYPMPKVTRYREYAHPNGWTYRCSPNGSRLQTRGFGQTWTDGHTRAQLGELFNLFANPTEEVDA